MVAGVAGGGEGEKCVTESEVTGVQSLEHSSHFTPLRLSLVDPPRSVTLLRLSL